jgi:hypothetical protein
LASTVSTFQKLFWLLELSQFFCGNPGGLSHNPQCQKRQEICYSNTGSSLFDFGLYYSKAQISYLRFGT